MVTSIPVKNQGKYCLRNKFLLIVICCPIYHWLEVSSEVDNNSRARSASDIFTDD